MRISTFSRITLTYVSPWLLTAALCGCAQESKEIVVRGNLTNLPDGQLVMSSRSLKHDSPTYLDTVNTVNGQFTFAISRDSFPEPIEVNLTHYDKQGNKRIFDFPNNRKNYVLSTFMLEDGVEINGKLVEWDIPKAFNPPANLKAVRPDRPITGSRQSDVMYNDTADFRQVTKLGTLKTLIEQHPYSFYYLNDLKYRVGSLTDQQFRYVFDAFDREVRESPSGRRLSDYVATRGARKLTHQVTLPDANGQPQPILSEAANRNVIILWASWCGPCRQEIPELKKIYADFGQNKSVRMVSISVDENADRWKKALAEEKMPWTQLLMTAPVATYAHEYFGYNRSVPLLVVTDKAGKILKQMEGFDDAHIAQIRSALSSTGQQ